MFFVYTIVVAQNQDCEQFLCSDKSATSFGIFLTKTCFDYSTFWVETGIKNLAVSKIEVVECEPNRSVVVGEKH